MLAVIPARWGSTRFPGKPLAMLGDRPMLQHVWERCRAAKRIDDIVVATDDERIAKACKEFSARCLLTDPALPSGTDRAAVVAQEFVEFEGVLNVQGDEPCISPVTLNAVAGMLSQEGTQIATAVVALQDEERLQDINTVKVALASDSRALYFSRAPIPFHRSIPAAESGACYRHFGVYGFKRRTLLELAALPLSRLERIESLEQLRWLEAGYEIKCAVVEDDSRGVDTPEQLAAIERELKRQE